MNFEKYGNNEPPTNLNDSPWGNSYSQDLPPFNPDGQATKNEQGEKKEPISEKDLAMMMLDKSYEQQDTLVDWVNQIHKKQGMSDEVYSEYERYCKDVDPQATEEDWAEELEQQLEHQSDLDYRLIDALEDLERPENAGRSLGDILENRANSISSHMAVLEKSGTWYKMSDAQRDPLVARRNDYQELAKWAAGFREMLRQRDNITNITANDAAKIEVNLKNDIDIDGAIDDLKGEIQKREKALSVLASKDQRDYGNDVLSATIKLHEKQADLHVMKMIQLTNHGRSEYETVSPENATMAVTQYITDREKIISNLTEQRTHYVKGSEEYKALTKKRSKWLREIEAAHRVAEQLQLPIQRPEDPERIADEKQFEEEAQLDSEQPTAETEKPIANSEAELLAIRALLEDIRPDLEQLFAACRGSLSLEQATGYLLVSNQRMAESTDAYAEALQEAQDISHIHQVAGAYDEQIRLDYGYSTNAIHTIRQKAQALPAALRGPMLQYCQKVENTLAQIMQITKWKDGKYHKTPIEKTKADEQELKNEDVM